ncbi:hypothetical protein NDU88_009904 [Pleurodeles waltl]|uniref:Uncharacterized protein n=1 Tax=Pleurodeles waltl TaxID=8319 RepID=A0AAV7QYS1_PLEWA|nr:hypothetical protein NDU88_009904 [Pleurodeles waltl]
MGPGSPQPPGQAPDPQSTWPDPPPRGSVSAWCSSECPWRRPPHWGPSPHCLAAGRPNSPCHAVSAKATSLAATASPSGSVGLYLLALRIPRILIRGPPLCNLSSQARRPSRHFHAAAYRAVASLSSQGPTQAQPRPQHALSLRELLPPSTPPIKVPGAASTSPLRSQSATAILKPEATPPVPPYFYGSWGWPEMLNKFQ